MHHETILIHSPWIKLDQFLKFSGAADTGGHAKELVLSGAVWVNGEPCLQRGKKLTPGDEVQVGEQAYRVAAE